MEFEVDGQRRNWGQKWTWMMKVKEECMKVWMSKKDVLHQSKLIVGVNQTASRLR